MTDAEREIRALLREMAAEVVTVQSLSGDARRKAMTERVVTALVGMVTCMGILAGGLLVADKLDERSGAHIGVARNPQAQSTVESSRQGRSDGPVPGPRAKRLAAGSFQGHDYVLRMMKLDRATCLELRLGRGRSRSDAVCSLASAGRHYMEYSEVMIPDTRYVVVLGLVSGEVDSVALELEDGRRVDASISSAPGPVDYFYEFVKSHGDVINGVVVARGEDGRVLEQGRLCPRHVWGRNGVSLCE